MQWCIICAFHCFILAALIARTVEAFQFPPASIYHRHNNNVIRVYNVPIPSYSQSTDSFSKTFGRFNIVAVEEECSNDIIVTKGNEIYLQDVKNGWGNGAHPSTSLCLEFLSETVKKGDTILDYGTGSGILSIAAAKLGAKQCFAIDIDEDTLIAANRNMQLNGVADVVEVLHTRMVYVGDSDLFPLFDVTVANILPGPLSRLVTI